MKLKFSTYLATLSFIFFTGFYTFGFIVYRDLGNYNLSYAQSYQLDVDNSGSGEIQFYGDGITGIVGRLTLLNGSSVARSGSQDVRCVSFGQSIGSGTSWLSSGLAWINQPTTTSQFPANSNSYVGVKFLSGGGFVYGWILVEYTYSKIIIKSCAYENSGGSISAGAVGSGTTGISELDNESRLALFPNPVVNELNISVLENESFEATILNVDGTVVYKSSSIGNNLKVSTTEFPAGMFFIRLLLNDGRKLSESFVKQ